MTTERPRAPALIGDVVVSLYYFNVTDGTAYPDKVGSEFPDLESVRVEAVRRSADLLRNNPATFWNGDAWKMTVTDASLMVMFTLNFLAVSSPATDHYADRPSNKAEEGRSASLSGKEID